MELFTTIGTWFGYVGACTVSPDVTCRPLLAFLALGVAAGAALALVLIAYRAGTAREQTEADAQHVTSRAPKFQDRARYAPGEKGMGAQPTRQTGLPIAA